MRSSSRGLALVAAPAALAFAVPATAQPADTRSDAQVYFDADRALRRAATESDCGGRFIPRTLHRVVDLRYDLLALREYARRGDELLRLDTAAAAEEELCIGAGMDSIERNLQRAVSDTRLLRRRALRAGYRPPR